MKRVIVRRAAIVVVGFAMSLGAVTGAWASDIACKSRGGGSSIHCEDPYGAGMRCKLADDDSRPPPTHQGHLICQSSALSARYERLYAEQQRMLHKGTIQDADIAAWRVRRDACESARCLESLFAKFWRDREAMRHAPVRPAVPPAAIAATPDPVVHEPTSNAAPAQPAQAEAAPPEPPVMQARPEPANPTQMTAAATEPPAVPAVAQDIDSSPGKRNPAAMAMESLISGLAILGMGAGFLWTRRAARAQGGPRSHIPAAMTVAYGLLLVNALLLPFTLGLK